MHKTKITIAFRNVEQLWNFARRIKAIDMEINTQDKILTCDCSVEDLNLLEEYGGVVVGEYKGQSS